MRKLVILLLIIVPSLSFGQLNKPPRIFLNSQIISFDSVFLYPQNVDSIYVKKDSDGGQIFIYTKDQVWKYRTINEVLQITPYSHIILDKSITPIFFIDGKLIIKKTDAKIDYSYFATVTIKKLSEIESLKKPCKKIVIVEISLTDTKPEPKIYIRGNTIREIEDYFKNK
jgi:hypothetical protein